MEARAAVASFVSDLKKHIETPIVLWDERLTSAQAERDMIAAGTRREKRKVTIDKIAAALILQSYMDAHPGGV